MLVQTSTPQLLVNKDSLHYKLRFKEAELRSFKHCWMQAQMPMPQPPALAVAQYFKMRRNVAIRR
jgi:hypothetical protein